MALIATMVAMSWGMISWGQQEQLEIITIRAWTIGPDTPAFYRAENLILAAERLNKWLEDVGQMFGWRWKPTSGPSPGPASASGPSSRSREEIQM